jgi:ABC-2 type transport system ATP-binding protein
MIQIQKLLKAYNNVIALNSIDLTLRDGMIIGLLGPNGAGKTTLVSILSGTLKKNSGQVIIDGLDLDKNLPEIQTISSIVPQSLALYPNLTAYQNLEYFGILYGLQGKKLRERIEFSIEVASLQEFLNKRAVKFSGGMQRRLNMAIGLLNDPRILYLDEPTVGVDAQSRKYMLEMIKKLNINHNKIIIYTSHYISEIEQIADDVIIIDHGNIVLYEKLDKLQLTTDAIAIEVESLPGTTIDRLDAIDGIEINGGAITIVMNEMFYPRMIEALSIMHENRIRIKNIKFNPHKLEDLYLNLTSTKLSDNE